MLSFSNFILSESRRTDAVARRNDRFSKTMHDSGEVWKTSEGKWGAKNRDGRTEYFDSERYARMFAQEMDESARVDKDSMPCNKPRPSTRPGKKKMVKGCEGGVEKIIHYGAKGYGNNYSAAARKSFKARHNCDTADSKLTARRWSCKDLWGGEQKGADTRSCPKGRKCKY